MPRPSSLDDAETRIGLQEPVSVSLRLPLFYLTPSTPASDFGLSSPILNIRQIPQLEKPLPPLPPRPVSKKFVSIQPELPLPRKRLVNRPSRWIRFSLWFNTYR